MREQKKIAVWTGIVCVISLAIAIVANCKNSPFVSNIFIGIFSSSLLACLIALISYFMERIHTLSLLYNGCLDFIESLNLNLSNDCRMDIKDVKANFLSMKNVYLRDVFPYVSRLSTIPKKSSLGKNIFDIDKYTEELYNAIENDKSVIDGFYLGHITQEEIVHYPWKYLSPDSVNSLNLLCSSLDKLARKQLKTSIKEVSTHAD